jgi:uncharacterized protein YrrD
MEFKKDTHVYSADNKDLGRIERVVINPTTKKVTHVVIRQGLFFTEDKVVPVDYFDEAASEQAFIRHNSSILDDLPKFEEIEYTPMDPADLEAAYGKFEEPPFFLYWNPPLGVTPYYTTGYYGSAPLPVREGVPEYPRYVQHTKQNIPEDTVALQEGAHVHSSDGEHVGDIEDIYVDPQTDYATHVMISQGFLLKEKKWLPTLWFRTVTEDDVYLAVRASTVEKLPAA